jgi:hypothetical protein
MTGLMRRGARYYVRRVIPLDLQELFGKREIVRSLGTSDPKEAKRLWLVAWAKFDRVFDQARNRNAISETMPQTGPQTVSDAEFDWQMEQRAFQDQEALEDADAEADEDGREELRQQIDHRIPVNRPSAKHPRPYAYRSVSEPISWKGMGARTS